MIARTSTGSIARASLSFAIAQASIRTALPCGVPVLQAARSFRSCCIVQESAKSATFLPESESNSEGNISHLSRLEYLLKEPMAPSQESLVAQLSDKDIDQLPLVVGGGDKWKLADPAFTFPRRERSVDSNGTTLSAAGNGEYLYNTFSLPTLTHLKRFHKEVADIFDTKARTVNPVILLDSRSRSLAIGLPSHIGLEPPNPAKQNRDVIVKLLEQSRSNEASEEQKRQAAQKLRSHVTTHGFRKQAKHLTHLLFSLYDAVRNASLEEVTRKTTPFIASAMPPARNSSTVEDSVPVDVSSQATLSIAQRASNTWQKERRKAGKANKDQARTPARSSSKKQTSIADRLRADDPKLPEAGTFVAQDGDAHKSSDGVDALQEHVPFPTPTAKEMGIEKPSETSRLSPDNPKLPEAGTFVAEDGDAHRPSRGVDGLQEHVPFPKPTADEMGIKKPTET